MTRRYLLALIGAPLLSPAKVKKVVADLSEQTLTTTYEAVPLPMSLTQVHIQMKETK